jgi:adenylylsulfate kinase
MVRKVGRRLLSEVCLLNHNVLVSHEGITREARERLNGHRGAVVWFTGLSASGKSTLAYGVEERLHAAGHHAFVLDGDKIRLGLCSDLGFSDADRAENIRRVGEVAKLFAQSGTIVLAAFISPLAKDRAYVRRLMQGENFFQVYCDCSLEVCEQRDPKGLYRKARQGLIKEFTGISSRYEKPEDADLVLNTAKEPVEESIGRAIKFLRDKKIILSLF